MTAAASSSSKKTTHKLSAHLHRVERNSTFYLLAIIVMLAAIVVINALYVVHRVKLTANAATASVELRSNNRYYPSQQTARTGALTARISNVTENSQMDYAFTYDSSETMLILNVRLTNNTNKTQHLLPSSQLFVHTGEGEYAALHASMFVTKPLAATDVKPGQTVSGQVSFNVPKHAADPLLYIDTGWNGYTPAIFHVLQ